MVDLLQPPIELVDSFALSDRTATVLVDCGLGASNQLLTRCQIRPAGLIDHHANGKSPDELPFVDLRPDVAASASIGASYLREQEVEPGFKLATALLYAIRTETRRFSRRSDTFTRARSWCGISNPPTSCFASSKGDATSSSCSTSAWRSSFESDARSRHRIFWVRQGLSLPSRSEEKSPTCASMCTRWAFCFTTRCRAGFRSKATASRRRCTRRRSSVPRPSRTFCPLLRRLPRGCAPWSTGAWPRTSATGPPTPMRCSKRSSTPYPRPCFGCQKPAQRRPWPPHPRPAFPAPSSFRPSGRVWRIPPSTRRIRLRTQDQTGTSLGPVRRAGSGRRWSDRFWSEVPPSVWPFATTVNRILAPRSPRPVPSPRYSATRPQNHSASPPPPRPSSTSSASPTRTYSSTTCRWAKARCHVPCRRELTRFGWRRTDTRLGATPSPWRRARRSRS